MKIDVKIKMKNYTITLTETQQKHQHYLQLRLINMNILQVRKYYHLIKAESQNKLSRHSLHSVKHLKNNRITEDQGIKHVEALKLLKPEENQELESIDGRFSKRREIMKLKMKLKRKSNKKI